MPAASESSPGALGSWALQVWALQGLQGVRLLSRRKGEEGRPSCSFARQFQCWRSGSDFPRNSLDQRKTNMSQITELRPKILFSEVLKGLSEEVTRGGSHKSQEDLYEVLSKVVRAPVAPAGSIPT
jgi:hypothetical protein